MLAAAGLNNAAIIGLIIGGVSLAAATSAAVYGWVAKSLRYNQQIMLVFGLCLIFAAVIAMTGSVPIIAAK